MGLEGEGEENVVREEEEEGDELKGGEEEREGKEEGEEEKGTQVRGLLGTRGEGGGDNMCVVSAYNFAVDLSSSIHLIFHQ